MISRERGLDLAVGIATLCAVLWSVSSACTIPTVPVVPPCGPASADSSCVAINLTATGDGQFHYHLDSLVFAGVATGSIQQTVRVRAGTYTVSGTMVTATSLTFFLQTETSGAVATAPQIELTSFQSNSGPAVATPVVCHMSYATAGATLPQDFSFTFVIGSAAPYC